MAIWSALLIPFATALVLYFFFRHKLVWWEVLIPFGISLILIVIAKYAVEATQTNDTEYWTGWITEARYYEPWTEEWDVWVPETTDSNGNVIVPSHFEHHVQNHSPQWNMYDNNGLSFVITKDAYENIVKRYGNHVEKNLYHINQTSWGDGDMWYTTWNHLQKTMVICTSKHTYENRVQASKSVFKFPEVDPKGLFEYPEINKDRTNVPSILGGGTPAENRLLSIKNAELGAQKQVRMWILLFNNQPLQTGLDQESYWQGGNKNEFVVCIGVNENLIQWVHVFSWTEVERLKIDVRDFVRQQKELNLSEIVEFMSKEVKENFVRKQFADFSYLTVTPPFGAVVAIFIITILVNGSCAVFAIFNQFDAENPSRHTFTKGENYD